MKTKFDTIAKGITISEAAKLAGVLRQTQIDNGELSRKTNKRLDFSELLRVYPDLSTEDSMKDETSNKDISLQTELPLLSQENEHLKKTMKRSESQLEKAENRLSDAQAERDRLLVIIERQTLALPDPTLAKTNSSWLFLFFTKKE